MKYINFKRYKFSTIFKNINFRRYNFSRIYKFFDLKRYNFPKIYKFFDLKRYNFSKIYKFLDLQKYKYFPVYVTCFFVFAIIVYLSIPMFFTYDKSKIENIICKDFEIKCLIEGEINYTFFPLPRIKLSNLVIKDSNEKNTILGKVEKAEIELSFYNLHNKKKHSFTNIHLINAKVNFNLENFGRYKNFSKIKFNSYPINLKNGDIKLFENKKYIANIKNVKFKYRSNENVDKADLKGDFLNDKINITFKNKKTEKKLSKFLTFKLLDSQLLVKANFSNSDLDEDVISGNISLKKKKNKLMAIFNYKDNQVVFKNANLRNDFLDGKFRGDIKFLPYFNFNLEVELNGLNFNKFYNFIIGLDQKNLFRVNNKINGQLNLSTNKVYSKYGLIDFFESRIKFINGDIHIERFLFNLGKLGAADLSGMVKNKKKYTNFNFENNIFIDNQKYFFSKFGIYNKKNIPSNLFISGNFDLTNLKLYLHEISNDQKFKDEDLKYIEKEINSHLLEDGYKSFFNYLKLKEFIKLIMAETN